MAIAGSPDSSGCSKAFYNRKRFKSTPGKITFPRAKRLPIKPRLQHKKIGQQKGDLQSLFPSRILAQELGAASGVCPGSRVQLRKPI